MSTPVISFASLQPSDLLNTAALLQRPERSPDLQAEAAAFCELSQLLARDPHAAVRRFLEIALLLCDAGTAGLSLLQLNVRGEKVLQWEAVSGALAAHVGTQTPREFSICGLCLDTGEAVLVEQPDRVFTYLQNTPPPIVEALVVPLYDTARRQLGTMWIAHHAPASSFCVNDLRVIEQLASQLVLALKLVRQTTDYNEALTQIESHKSAQRTSVCNLNEERSRRERAETAETGIRKALVFKNAVIQEAHHRVKNTIQIAASVLSLQARATASMEVRAALNEGYGRLTVLAKVHEMLYRSADSMEQILMPTLLQAMGSALRQSFAELMGRVQLKVTCGPIVLSPDVAIPLALFANEAITNAYKHAFPGNRSGEITIHLSRGAEGSIVLQIADTGIGIRSDCSKSGLGLKLIHSFATQLNGTLTFGAGPDATGASVTLEIHPVN